MDSVIILACNYKKDDNYIAHIMKNKVIYIRTVLMEDTDYNEVFEYEGQANDENFVNCIPLDFFEQNLP